jgi:hypothetical protein
MGASDEGTRGVTIGAFPIWLNWLGTVDGATTSDCDLTGCCKRSVVIDELSPGIFLRRCLYEGLPSNMVILRSICGRSAAEMGVPVVLAGSKSSKERFLLLTDWMLDESRRCW